MRPQARRLIALALLAGVSALPAHTAYVATITESAGNVVATSVGSINTTGAASTAAVAGTQLALVVLRWWCRAVPWSSSISATR